MPSEDMRSSLLECLRDPEFLTLLRDEVMAPIIRSLVTEAVAERDQQISDLKQELKEVRTELKEVRTEVNALEQYSRRSCLNISGMPESTGESTDEIVRSVAAAAGVTLSAADIDSSHRVGRQQDGKRRTIIVKLSSRVCRDKLYEARKVLRSSRSSVLSEDILRGVFISENLTKANQHVMYTARQLKRRGVLHSAWTDNCRMKIRLRANGNTRVIQCMDDLRELVGDQPEFAALEHRAEAAPAGDPAEPRTPAAAAAAAHGPDAEGYQLAGGRGGARSGAKRGAKTDTRRGRSAGQ